MNQYRLFGDISHMIAIVIMILKILKKQTCHDVSGQSQILFTLVFLTRYVDIFTSFISFYNSAMKVFYVASSVFILYLIYVKFKDTYEGDKGILRMEFLIIPCFILALFFNNHFDLFEILWAFSIYLESVAIVPQFLLLLQKEFIEPSMVLYLSPLFAYRAFYILNWFYRYKTEQYFDPIAFLAGFVYVIIYIVFFFKFNIDYVRKRRQQMRIIRIVDRTFDAEENRGFLDNEANEANIKIEAQN